VFFGGYINANAKGFFTQERFKRVIGTVNAGCPFYSCGFMALDVA